MGSVMNLFSDPSNNLPPLPAPPPVPTLEDPEVAERREQVRLSALRRRGRASTILTSGLGDASAPSVRRTTLGGE